jgi:hypothetical protein
MAAAQRFDPQHASIGSSADDSAAAFQAASAGFMVAIPPGEIEAEIRQED